VSAGGDDIAVLFGALWPGSGPTPLLDLPELAARCDVAQVLVKDESRRPLGTFKALGGTYAGLRALARTAGAPSVAALLAAKPAREALPPLICASAGNHGLAVAAAAQFAGTRARIFLAADADETRIRRLTTAGAEVVRVQGDYDDAVAVAAKAAAEGAGLLIADISQRRDDPATADVMAGYGLMAQEIDEQLRAGGGRTPTHLFVQGGVGGLAAALGQGLCDRLALSPRIVVVEPAAAACIAAGLAAGRPVRLRGDLTTAAAMLSCGQASAPALQILMRLRAVAIGVDEAALQTAIVSLHQAGDLATTPSGAAGLAGLLAARAAGTQNLGLTEQSIVLLVVTEGT
jgi:diaminopropionate ammonia-lyase